MESLSPKVIHSGFWSLGGNWLSRGLGVIKLIILARLLSPQDFGIIGLAILSVNMLNVFSETGIESALIQKQKIGRAELDTAWTIGIMRGVILFLILFLSAEWFAIYFDNLTLIPVLKVMAIVFFVEGLKNIGIIFFQRDLEFNKRVTLDLISDVVGTLAAIILAFWLRNVWALVFGSIFWIITKCLGSYIMHVYRPKICWNWRVAKSLLNFGKHIFVISLITFILTSGDDAIIAKILGLTILGFYTMAYNIANLPVSSLTGIVGKISFPAYSMLQDKPERLSDAFRRVNEAMLIILLPLTALIILLSRDFTIIFLGDKWLPMVPGLKILALLGFFRGLCNMFAPIQLAVKRPEIQSRNKVVELILFLSLVYPFTAKWGFLGACWSVTLVYMGSSVINALSSASLMPSFFNILLKISWLPLVATLGLIFATWLTNSWLKNCGELFRFTFAGISGVVVFSSIIIILRKNLLREIIQNFQEAK